MVDVEKKFKVHIDKNWPLFGQIPLKLLRDSKIRLQAKALFGILHTYTFHKQLMGNPELTISMATLCKDTGLTESNVRRWLYVLRDEGWIWIKRRGMTMTNKIILYGTCKSKQRKLERDRKKLKEIQYRLARDPELIERLSDSLKKTKMDK